MNMVVFIILLFSITLSIESQEARHKRQNVMDYDSLAYIKAMDYFNKGRNKKAREEFRYVLHGDYSKWNDSAMSFLKKNNKLIWVTDIDEFVIKGYTVGDSLFYVYGRSMYLKDELIETAKYFNDYKQYGYQKFRSSIYYDSAMVIMDDVRKSLDSIRVIEKFEKEQMERKWVYLGDFYGRDKSGVNSYDAYPTYYDENHLLYEGDSVCVMLKGGDYSPTYKYVTLNLKTRLVHGIDASYYGQSYSFLWDGDWWKTPESDFARVLYEAVKKY